MGDRTRAEIEAYAAHFVPCPVCEVLCFAAGSASDPALWDLSPRDVDGLLIPGVGLRTYLRHGVGVGGHARHRCPPTRAALAPIRPVSNN